MKISQKDKPWIVSIAINSHVTNVLELMVSIYEDH